MNNIEKLAIEHGVITKAGVFGFEHSVYIFGLEQLESFAKALQSSEPVSYAYPDNVDLNSYKDLDVTYVVCSKKRDDFTQPLFTHPPASVPLWKYNKLLDALKHAHLFIRNGIELGYISMPEEQLNDPASKTPSIVEQAIAEAEGKEG